MSDARKPPYVTVTRGMSGFFAVKVSWNSAGFWEPEETGIRRYPLAPLAASEAREWAEAEGIQYVAPRGMGL